MRGEISIKLQIVTVYNNKDLFHGMKDSIFSRGGGTLECEIIALDNTAGQFSSAAEAYNYALDYECSADVLVFCHQDIVFLEGSIDKILELCSKNDVLYGAGGVKNVGHFGGNNRIISAMASPDENSRFTSLEKDSTEEVFTLDECLIAANKHVFDRIRFDEKVCNGWHFYAVELSLQCHVKNIPVKVFDANIVHLSGGTQDKTFYQIERNVVEKYRGVFPIISYTCGWAYTGRILYLLLSLYRKVRYGI